MKTFEEMEKYFWDNYPHEISWGELKECNEELFNELQKIGKKLVEIDLLQKEYLGIEL
jgi:hypothetical protein